MHEHDIRHSKGFRLHSASSCQECPREHVATRQHSLSLGLQTRLSEQPCVLHEVLGRGSKGGGSAHSWVGPATPPPLSAEDRIPGKVPLQRLLCDVPLFVPKLCSCLRADTLMQKPPQESTLLTGQDLGQDCDPCCSVTNTDLVVMKKCKSRHLVLRGAPP